MIMESESDLTIHIIIMSPMIIIPTNAAIPLDTQTIKGSLQVLSKRMLLAFICRDSPTRMFGQAEAATIHAFFLAVERGVAEEVTQLLGHDPRLLEAVGEQEIRPLMLASTMGLVKMMTMLLERGADVHAVDAEECCTALHLAARQGHEQVVEVLLGSGAAARCRNVWDETPLMLAAEEGHVSVVARLVSVVGQEGLNDMDVDGHTALCCACVRGQVEAATLLLQAGADPDISAIYSHMPSHDAQSPGHVSCLQLLQVRAAALAARDK
jgi:ankyrin repeat protein